MPDSPVEPIVMASGEMIGFKMFGADGVTPSNVDSMASPSEAQKIIFSGIPAGGTYALSFNGQTTGPIATTQGPPEVYAEWSVALTSAGNWDVAINTVFGSPWSPAATYEVFDGAATTPLVTTALNTINGSGNPTPFTDGTLAGNGSAIQWYPVGINLAFTGTTCRVRLSGPGVVTDNAVNGLQTDYVRAAPHAGGTAILQSSAGITLVGAINGPHFWNNNNDSRLVGPSPSGYFSQGLGAGPQTETDPAAVQSALTGLSTIGAGNLTASGIGNPFSPVALNFVGSLALSPQNLITCTDAAVQVTRSNAGGLWPTIKINGGSTIRLDNPLYYSGNYDSNGNARAHSPYMPLVAFPLFQAHPAVSYEPNTTYENTLAGNWNTPNEAGISMSVSGNYSPYYRITTGSDGSATGRWPRPALKPGTYRISFARPSDASFSADAVWTVTNRVGTVLLTYHDNQTVALSGNVDQGVSWHILGSFTIAPGVLSDDLTVTLSNATSTRMVADTVRFERTSADDSVKILATDTVTVSYGAAWATSVYGPSAAATDATVTNLTGQAIYPALPTTVTMPLGYNLPDQQPYSGSFWYTNLIRSVNGINANLDGDGYPTSTTGAGSVSAIAVQAQEQHRGDGLIMPSLPPGDYTLMWDGQSDMALENAAEQTGLASVSLTPGATNNKRVYTIAAAFRSYGITLVPKWFAIPSTTTIDAKNIRIYRNAEVPDVTSPPKFLPSLMTQRLAGAKSMRFLDPMGAINGNATDFADFNPPQSRLARTSPTRALAPVITRIEAYTGPILFDPGTVPVLITTAANHGLAEGQYTDFIEGFSGTVTLSDGHSTIDLAFQTFGYIYYVSPNTFVFRLVPPGGATSQTMTNVLTGTNLGVVHVNIGNGMPLQDLVEMCNQLGCDLWLQTTVCATDACISAIGEFVALNLNPGLKVRFEYTNEPWNTTSKPYSWIGPQGYRLGYSGVATNYLPFYVREANRHAGLIRTAMAAHGRGSDLSLMLNTRFFTFGDTGDVCQICRDNGLSFDMLAFSLYFDNGPSFHPPVNNPIEPPLFPIYNMLTADQVIDVYEAMVTFTGWGKPEFDPHRAILKSSGESSTGAGDGPFANTPIGAYEGGPERDLPLGAGGFTDINAARRAHQIKYHPRNRGLILHTIRTYADGGCHIMHLFHTGGGDGGSGDNNYSAWSAYVGTGMPPYVPGSPTQDAIQVNQYNRLDLTQSMTGSAFNTWQSLFAAGGTPATTYTAPISPTSVAPGSSTTATITPNGTFTGTITGTPGGSASTGLSAIVKTFSGPATPQTATWTPTVAGTLTITWTNSGGLTDPANDSVTVTTATATTYTAPISPTTITLGSATTATVTPNHSYTGTITGTPSGSASTGLSPATLTFSGSAAPQTASWTPTASGTLTITWTNNGSLTNPANDTVTVNAAALAAGTITGSATSSTTASLSCPDPTGGTPPIVGRQWYRNTSGSGPVGGDAVSGATGNTLSDTGLTPGTTYYYFFQAVDSASGNAGTGPYSVTTPGGSSTITGVSVSPASATVPGGAGLQFTATVTGTGAFSASVTWTKTGAGSVGAGGLYAAPAATTSMQSSSVIATSDQDGAFSGTATITVPAEAATQAPGGSARRRWFPMHHR